MKCFQLSCWCRPKLICTNGRHFGRLGLRMRCMPASCGVRLALRVLHAMHEQTMFSHVVGPPRSRGMTWSRFRSLRSKIFAAVLAGVLVALENVVPGELDFLLWQTIKDQQQNDPRARGCGRRWCDHFVVWRVAEKSCHSKS